MEGPAPALVAQGILRVFFRSVQGAVELPGTLKQGFLMAGEGDTWVNIGNNIGNLFKAQTWNNVGANLTTEWNDFKEDWKNHPERKTGEMIGKAIEIFIGLKLALPAKKGPGIIYKRTNPITGKEYVGKVKSYKRYLERQGEHNRELGVKHRYDIIQRGIEEGLPLDVAEETWMRKLGGLEKEGGTLANKRHACTQERYLKGGGTFPGPRNP